MNDNAKAWVEALRSGDFEQTQRELYDGNGYCCLGVACKLYGEVHGIEFTHEVMEVEQYDDDHEGPTMVTVESEKLYFLGTYEVLPDPVREWLGLAVEDGTWDTDNSLAARNDSGATFEQIASIIEAEPQGLFVS